MFASLLSQNSKVSHSISPTASKLYLHIIMTSKYRSPKDAAPDSGAKLTVTAGDSKMDFVEGDGAYMEVKPGQGGSLEITSSGDSRAEFLLFEME